MFAELLQRCLDAEFDESFSEHGTFRRKKSKGRFYWHHQQRLVAQVVSKYVGPVADKSITERVSRFADVKSNFKRRQEMVRALSGAGLPAPDPISGAIVEAMWKAGFSGCAAFSSARLRFKLMPVRSAFVLAASDCGLTMLIPRNSGVFQRM
jgi:hypothetical protein